MDHALRWGWDNEHGGFYDEGPPTGAATRTDKVWWVQVEALNGLLTAAHLAPQNGEYFRRFTETWAFFRRHMIDDRYGDCYDTVAPDGQPLRVNKATPWKAAYHVTRALLFTAHTLRRPVKSNPTLQEIATMASGFTFGRRVFFLTAAIVLFFCTLSQAAEPDFFVADQWQRPVVGQAAGAQGGRQRRSTGQLCREPSRRSGS